jgi:hypothetical protein
MNIKCEPQQRVERALSLIADYGSIDGSHHKDWVLDQVVRILAGPDYSDFVAEVTKGEYGPNTYEWNVGIAP